MDVKKLMEQMKNNKSHRSFASIENRTDKMSDNNERRPGELYHSYSKNTSVPPFYSNLNQDSHHSMGSTHFQNYNHYSSPQSTGFPPNNPYPPQPVYMSQSFGQMPQFAQQNQPYVQPSQPFPMSQMSQSFGQAPYPQPSSFGNSVEFSNSRPQESF